ncbi:hypothetical protein BJ965_001035 [Streptomyces luteogriseus]|uniref:Uncharacterized protein n=1 Tax=Streptomyces luteogriseus TaxID=68233 RepID=A0A7W7GG89_9ACTN|nr:hypothetical protein [Streptomyces luteogriseus]MBB4711153.1 hypothetical protein [Streptomyces luteogriseus]
MNHLTTIAAQDTTPTSRALPFLADEPRQHPTGDAVEILGALARECQLRGITPEITEDGSVDLTVPHVDGHRVFVGPYDSAADALDDIRKLGCCHGCRSEVDDTAALYADKWLHIDGSPIRICPACRGEQATVANGQITAVGKQAFAEMARDIHASTAAAKNPALALERVLAALPEILPGVLKRTVPSASDETAGLLVADISARLRALSA